MTKEILINKASKGDKAVQYQLGLIYCFSGDVRKAIFWLEKAKEQKCDKAVDALNEIKVKVYGIKEASHRNGWNKN